MKYLSILFLTVILSSSYSVLGQNCFNSKLSNLEIFNNSDENEINIFLQQDNFFLSKLCNNKNICKDKNNISYIYTSTFQVSGYNIENSPMTYSIYFFSKDYKLIYWYEGRVKSFLNKSKMSLDIQSNDEIDSSRLEYIQSVLKQVSINDTRNIEKEQTEIISGCNCANYESIYYITPNITKAYFFDLYYKKLFNGDFDEDLKKELEELHKQLIE